MMEKEIQFGPDNKIQIGSNLYEYLSEDDQYMYFNVTKKNGVSVRVTMNKETGKFNFDLEDSLKIVGCKSLEEFLLNDNQLDGFSELQKQGKIKRLNNRIQIII